MEVFLTISLSYTCLNFYTRAFLATIGQMASKNAKVIQGIAITDADGRRRKYLNTANGRIEDLPSQKMVFDTDTGKLMVVLSNDKTIALDNRVFTEMDADGFFVKTALNWQQDRQP